jgi:hypothetical protein
MNSLLARNISGRPARVFVTFTLAACLGLVSASSAGAETLWALERNGPSLRIIERTTGVDLGTISNSVNGSWRGIAIHPTSGIMYASDTEYLHRIDKSTGVATQIGLFGSVVIRDLAFDNLGQLYGITGNQGSNAHSLHSINIASGSATFLLSLSGIAGHGIAHDTENPGTLYHLAVETLFQLESYVFEKVDLATTVVTAIALSGDAIVGRPLALEFDQIDEVFRFFDDTGRYYSVDRDGLVSAVGTQNPTLYSGLGYDPVTFPSSLFTDGFESGDTDAWSDVTP